jgi:hypothetical protein
MSEQWRWEKERNSGVGKVRQRGEGWKRESNSSQKVIDVEKDAGDRKKLNFPGKNRRERIRERAEGWNQKNICITSRWW